VKLDYPFLFWFIGCLPFALLAQPSFDAQAFRGMAPVERQNFICQLNMEEMDTATFFAMYRPMFQIAQSEKDLHSAWALRFKHFQQRHKLNFSKEEGIAFSISLLKEARGANLEAEAVVAEHYVNFEKYNAQLMPHGQLYAYILEEFGRMEEMGFEAFKQYDLARLLFHSGKFMYELEDFEMALKIMLAAETFAKPSDAGIRHWILSINLIESIYQQQKEYDKGIAYAQKILDTTKQYKGGLPGQLKLCNIWQGIASIDIADMLVKQGKFAEGEAYANMGYEQVKSTDPDDVQTEFDALLILVPTKLELGKMDEAASLLQRMDEIYKAVGDNKYYYFKNIRFFETYAKYHELRGEYAAAIHYTKLAKPLQDSLNRRNDARALEKIQQRLEAEKYSAKLRLVESEKQLQTWLRNAALVILLLVTALAYGNYHRLQYKRKQALKELESAKIELQSFTLRLREKAELAENLRLELDNLARSGERSEYLEKLTRSTILTDQDWTQFRSIFEKVHPDFIAEQKTLHPGLTQAELRYLVLEKLQLSTHEMANMLGVSDGTIRQTRMRLKRKIGEG
jgi:tetratricopeptide (TPR) repeat protein